MDLYHLEHSLNAQMGSTRGKKVSTYLLTLFLVMDMNSERAWIKVGKKLHVILNKASVKNIHYLCIFTMYRGMTHYEFIMALHTVLIIDREAREIMYCV